MSVILELAEKIASHDLTHEMSDDPRWYKAGRAELREIKELAKQVPECVFNALWNDKVLRGVKYEYCYMFLRGETQTEFNRRRKEEEEKG